jgi:hypothetical protein
MVRKKKPKNFIFRMCDECERKTKFYIKYKNYRVPKRFYWFLQLFHLKNDERVKERIETCSKCGNIYVTDMKKS